ncbi:MAG TPA: LON peptidase substrate-binding domain-containing protein [Sphingobium sp.]|nr:LON peptidase substrate-binding domain-containing protein [Sphingobium sp.]
MGRRLAIFPLAGAILLPRAQLSLHIFEPRYRAMVSDAMARDQRIGMIQPSGPGEPAPLFSIGCIGRITDVEALEDGRFNITLTGESRFRILRELDVATPFRQVEPELIAQEDGQRTILAPSERAALEGESRIFAETLGYAVKWDAVHGLDDETLVNAIAQIAPFDIAGKQALLEADNLPERADLAIQLMQFMRRENGQQGSARPH